MQNASLRNYAVSSTCGDRKFPETWAKSGSCFQCDRDRILRSSAFRRLDFKTQVFVPHEHDHFRTRLTHSLEVAQEGRNLARMLGLNEDLVEAVALAHDLGHPPFGHVGEKVLDELMADHGHFEHNRQSLRIVDYLEHPFPPFRGLNLTNVTRECIARHETPYDTPACEEFDPDTFAPLEGQLVGLADEIAYTSADLEDALAAGWINRDQLEDLDLWREAWQRAEEMFPRARAIHKRIQATRAVTAVLGDDLLETTRANLRDCGIDSPNAAREAKERIVGFSPAMAGRLRQLQRFLRERVYLHPINVRQGEIARGILRELFGKFVQSPERLPQRYRKRINDDHPTDPDASSLHRVVCDYVAGMTNRFCRAEYARICR